MSEALYAGGDAPIQRPVPYDLQAEEAVLGSLLLDRDAVIKIATFLLPTDFYREANGWIYQSVLDLYARREPPDLVTLSSELDRRGKLEPVGGLAYLSGLMHRVPTAVHIVYYARIVERASKLRQLISIGGRIAGLGYEEGLELDAVLDKAESLLFGVTQTRLKGGGGVTAQEVVWSYLTALEARMRGETVPGTAWATGLSRFDEMTGGGIKPGKVTLIIGESGGGKSTVLTDLVLRLVTEGAAHKQDVLAGLFSYEMLEPELVGRLLANRARIDSLVLDSGMLSPAEHARVMEAGSVLASLPPIRLITGGGYTLRDIAAQARAWKADGGLDVLALDYLQLVRVTDASNTACWDELANGLKSLAMELDIAVIEAAQLSRAAVGRNAKDWDDYIRNSGAFKHAADVVIAVAPDDDPRPAAAATPVAMTWDVTKDRGAKTGPIPMLWWPAYSRIAEVESRYGA